MKVLIIDDDQKLGRLLKEYLGQNGMTVDHALRPSQGLANLVKGGYDLVILDVMMPEEDGFSVCKKIRSKSSIPIIMLTARGDVFDRVVGLELGADDYLSKPFEPRELLARINAVARRGEAQQADIILVRGPISIDRHKRSVLLNGSALELSTAEFEVLTVLVEQPKRVFSRDQLIERLHGTGWSSFERSVDVLISRLRQKLKISEDQEELIATVRGVGYKYVGGEASDV